MSFPFFFLHHKKVYLKELNQDQKKERKKRKLGSVAWKHLDNFISRNIQWGVNEFTYEWTFIIHEVENFLKVMKRKKGFCNISRIKCFFEILFICYFVEGKNTHELWRVWVWMTSFKGVGWWIRVILTWFFIYLDPYLPGSSESLQFISKLSSFPKLPNTWSPEKYLSTENLNSKMNQKHFPAQRKPPTNRIT